MEVLKKQQDESRFLAKDFWYESARVAMGDFLAVYAKHMSSYGPVHVLVPAYIGVSPKEGSGIFDPLCALQEQGLISIVFYELTENLYINLQSLEHQIDRLAGEPYVLLRVNYFGFVDPSSPVLYQYVKRTGGCVLEDSAHAFFSYMHQKELSSDAVFFSLHKQFPFSEGGMLRVNNTELFPLSYSGGKAPKDGSNPWCYNLSLIAQAYRSNFEICEEFTRLNPEQWIPLRSLAQHDGIVPQSYPILLRHADRFQIYLEMNELGFGVTSLYHTMIDPLKGQEGSYPSVVTSKSILNIPTHPDVEGDQLQRLLRELFDLCSQMSCEG